MHSTPLQKKKKKKKKKKKQKKKKKKKKKKTKQKNQTKKKTKNKQTKYAYSYDVRMSKVRKFLTKRWLTQKLNKTHNERLKQVHTRKVTR